MAEQPTAKAETAKQRAVAAAADKRAAATLFKSSKVRVPKLDGDGEPIKIAQGPLKGTYDVVERTITADDILAVREPDGRVTAITVDGQRLQADSR